MARNTSQGTDALVLDYQLTLNDYLTHDGEWVAILFADNHIKGVSNEDGRFNNPDGSTAYFDTIFINADKE